MRLPELDSLTEDDWRQAIWSYPLGDPRTFARVLGVHPGTVRRWCRDGVIPLALCVPRRYTFWVPAALQALRERAGRLTR